MRISTILAPVLLAATLTLAAAPAAQADPPNHHRFTPNHHQYTVVHIDRGRGSVQATCTGGGKVTGGTAHVMQPGIGQVTRTAVVNGSDRRPGSVTARYRVRAEGNIEFDLTCTNRRR